MSLLSLTTADWHDRATKLRFETRHFIDGEYVDSLSPERLAVVNPATGQVLTEVSAGSAADIDRAVAAAKRSFYARVWSRKAPRERMAVLAKFAPADRGECRTFRTARHPVHGQADSRHGGDRRAGRGRQFRLFRGTHRQDRRHRDRDGRRCISLHLARAAGRRRLYRAVELSPADGGLEGRACARGREFGRPQTRRAVAALRSTHGAAVSSKRAGRPACSTSVNGHGEAAGAALALHSDVAKIAFTGSTEIGKQMLVYAGQSNMKRVSLECGGKSPQIFLADLPDLDVAVSYAINGIFGNMGEVCNAGSRLLVDKPIAEEFLARFIERGRTAYVAGDPLDPATNLGPLVTAAHRARVLHYIGAGKAEGAKLEFGGTTPRPRGGGS